MNNSELKIEEIKKIAYKILKDVTDFCDENHLQYFLACGTALGAVRHNGFIPWDDDVDIAMPRPDYEVFLSTYRSNQFALYDARNNKNYPYAFAKVCDESTVLIEHIENPVQLGVYIDVFPIDGLPEEKVERERHLKRIEWDMRILSWKRISVKKKKDILHKAYEIVAKTLLLPVPISTLVNRLEQDVKKYSYESASYVGHFVTKAAWGRDEKPKRIFEEPIKHTFEQDEFWIPGDYDEYLTLEYGEYMKLPPIEKQVPCHDYEVYWKSNFEKGVN